MEKENIEKDEKGKEIQNLKPEEKPGTDKSELNDGQNENKSGEENLPLITQILIHSIHA
ncbi:MAG: hypothetical protein U0V74_02040 [Chitinophagales bacterium]